MKNRITELIKAGKFAIVGGLNTLLDMAVFALLAQVLGVNPYLSQVVSYTVGALNSYVLNRSWTFGSRERFFSPALIKFLVVTGAMLLLSTALLGLFHEGMGMAKMVAKCCTVVITLVANFVINRLWVFSS